MVVVVSSIPMIFLSSTTAGAAGAPLFPIETPPLPPSPWQRAQLSAKTAAPCSAVPLPTGRPAPSGSMSMSHAAISAGSIGLPRLGPSPSAPPTPNVKVNNAVKVSALGVHMFDLTFVVDCPAHDGIEVV